MQNKATVLSWSSRNKESMRVGVCPGWRPMLCLPQSATKPHPILRWLKQSAPGIFSPTLATKAMGIDWNVFEQIVALCFFCFSPRPPLKFEKPKTKLPTLWGATAWGKNGKRSGPTLANQPSWHSLAFSQLTIRIFQKKVLWQPLDSHNGHEAPCGHNIETPDVAIVAFGGDIGRRNCSHALMEKCRTPNHEFNADSEPKVLQFPVKTKHMSKAGS